MTTTDETISKKMTKWAFEFLCKRNPLDLSQSEYVFMLMEFQEIHGDLAIQALAGAYIYAIDKLEADKSSEFILQVFSHDLGDRKEPCMLPRSSEYTEVWEEECKNRYIKTES